MRTRTALAALCFSSTVALADAPPALENLVPHRAVYDVTLDEASERSGISAIKGRMVYESRGSACEGFSVRFRFFQNVRTPRREYSSDQRTTTFESGDGERFEFVNRTFFNGSQEREVKGKAARSADGITVAIEASGSDEGTTDVELQPAQFPAAHIAAVIEAAQAGKRFLPVDVYDGSDTGDEVMATTAVIGKRNGPDATVVADPERAKQLADVPSWPVSVGYFSGEADASGERLPVYQVSFALHENGVSGDLVMRYEDYTLNAELKDLEYLERSDCPSE